MIFLNGCGQVTNEVAPENKTLRFTDARVIVAGDSIAKGYGMPFGQYLSEATVVTAQNGQTSIQLANDIENQILNYTPELVILNIGVNDNCNLANTENIKYIIDTCLSNNITMIVDTVPYIYDEMNLAPRIDEINNWLIKEYQGKVHFVYMNQIVTKYFTKDNLHPSFEGYSRMNDEYNKILRWINWRY